jgi:hypothetical protein
MATATPPTTRERLGHASEGVVAGVGEDPLRSVGAHRVCLPLVRTRYAGAPLSASSMHGRGATCRCGEGSSCRHLSMHSASATVYRTARNSSSWQRSTWRPRAKRDVLRGRRRPQFNRLSSVEPSQTNPPGFSQHGLPWAGLRVDLGYNQTMSRAMLISLSSLSPFSPSFLLQI